MRVIYWTEVFWPHIGGVEILSRQLVDALRRRKHDVSVLTSPCGHESSGQTMTDGLRIFRFPFQEAIAGRDLREVRKVAAGLNSLVENLRPDLIHVNSSQPSIFFLHHLHARHSVPTLFTLHEPPMLAHGRDSLVGRTLQTVDWVVGVSEATLSLARKLVPEISSRSSVILNGLEMPGLPAAPLPFVPPSLLCIGKIVREKGFDLVIGALRDIRRCIPGTRLVIAGDGPGRPALEQQAIDLGLKDEVLFVGWRQPDTIPALINTATIVIVPSRWQEPFGLVALQAAQMARPVIAARTGGLPEIVEHNETGLLFEKESSAALAETVLCLLRNPALAIRMGQSARTRAQREFGLSRVVKEYDTLYHSLFRKKQELAIGKQV